MSAARTFLALLIALVPLVPARAGEPPPSPMASQPWTETKVADALKAGKAVLIEFAADWSVGSVANRTTFLESPTVQAALRTQGVVWLRADYTQKDPGVAAALKRYGKTSVPTYVVLSPVAGREPVVFSEIRSVVDLVGTLERQAAPADTTPLPFEGRDTKAVKAAFPGTDRDVLEQPDSLEFLALHPYPGTADGTPAKPEDGFQGYKVIGRALLKDAKEKRQLIEALYKGLSGEYGPAAGCFNPRHALRARKGERTIDVLLCYQCETAHVFSSAHTVASGQQDGKAIVRLAKSGEDVLDALLKAHDLKKHVDPVK